MTAAKNSDRISYSAFVHITNEREHPLTKGQDLSVILAQAFLFVNVPLTCVLVAKVGSRFFG